MNKINDYFYKLLKKESKIHYFIKEDKIYLSDSYIISIIEKDKFYLNKELMIETPLDNFFKDFELEKVKRILHEEDLCILISDNFEIKINEKYYKLFKDYEFNIVLNKSTNLCIIKNENDIIGLILPIRVY